MGHEWPQLSDTNLCTPSPLQDVERGLVTLQTLTLVSQQSLFPDPSGSTQCKQCYQEWEQGENWACKSPRWCSNKFQKLLSPNPKVMGAMCLRIFQALDPSPYQEVGWALNQHFGLSVSQYTRDVKILVGKSHSPHPCSAWFITIQVIRNFAWGFKITFWRTVSRNTSCSR